MRALVIGGLGYLGSIVADKLFPYMEKLDIYDLCLYENENVIEELDIPSESVVDKIKFDYDIIVWCANIDISQYYNLKEKPDTIGLLKKFADSNKKIINCSTYTIDFRDAFSQCDEMFDYLEAVEKVVDDCKGLNLRIPDLYGPSPRMRWDTLINTLLYTALSQNIILLDHTCFSNIPTMGVADCADYIVSFCLDLVKDDYRYPAPFRKFYTDFISPIEVSYIIKNCFGDRLEQVHVPTNTDFIKITSPAYEEQSTLLDAKTNLHDIVDLLVKQFDKGALPDFENDKYNNRVMIQSLIQGVMMKERLDKWQS